MDAAFYRCIFSWQAKRVPAHGGEDIELSHDLVAGYNVAYDIVSSVADVKG